MITIFNRKHLCTTLTMDQYANIHDILKENNIKFKAYRVANFTSGSGVKGAGRTAIPGTEIKPMTCDIYVKEKDYNRAIQIIHNREKRK